MSILVMGIMLTCLEAMCEGIMAIVNMIMSIANGMMTKHRRRKRRGGNYIKRNYGYKNPYSIL